MAVKTGDYLWVVREEDMEAGSTDVELFAKEVDAKRCAVEKINQALSDRGYSRPAFCNFKPASDYAKKELDLFVYVEKRRIG